MKPLFCLLLALAAAPASAVDMTPMAESEAAAPVDTDLAGAERYRAAGNKFVATR